jgi:hypothetical protein
MPACWRMGKDLVVSEKEALIGIWVNFNLRVSISVRLCLPRR